MKIDEINAGSDVTMTADLIKLFAVAGCDPTLCHACGRKIKEGHLFKLVPHSKHNEHPPADEMCCAKCGPHELMLRDRREMRQARGGSSISRRSGGYSRPSKESGNG